LLCGARVDIVVPVKLNPNMKTSVLTLITAVSIAAFVGCQAQKKEEPMASTSTATHGASTTKKTSTKKTSTAASTEASPAAKKTTAKKKAEASPSPSEAASPSPTP
jgi:hypothetical protein